MRSERNSIDVADGYAYAPVAGEELGRPHAPFMHSQDGDRGTWSPPLGAGGAVYRNSAAGAIAGSTAALSGTGKPCIQYDPNDTHRFS